MSSSRRASHQCQQLLLDVQRYDVELAGGFVHHGLLGADLVLARSGSFGPSPLSPALILAVVEVVGSPAGAGSLLGGAAPSSQATGASASATLWVVAERLKDLRVDLGPGPASPSG